MNRRTFLTLLPWAGLASTPKASRTVVGIRGEQFLINGRPTYPGRVWNRARIEGLLMNARLVQGIFDDRNPDTRSRWAYPDTGQWDPERNTREFIAAMPVWRRHGLLSFTICLQGGSPQGYSQEQPWHNSAFEPDGSLVPAYMERLARILDRADALGMTPIVGYFYFGQDQRLETDEAVVRGTREATRWLLSRGYRHVLVEIANECDNRKYERGILKPPRIAELIRLVQAIGAEGGGRLLVSASFNGGSIPDASVIKAADFLLLHGNGVSDPARIAGMIAETKGRPGYRPMPIVFNEDDHFDFDRPVNNLLEAVRGYASWGYFDPGISNYRDGYQCPPVNWGLSTERKKAFFKRLKAITGT